MSLTTNPRDPFGWVGHTLDGKYRVDGVVGEGGFAVVYKAHHLGFNEPVALKCLKLPGSVSAEDRATFLATFLAEGRLLHQLSKATAGIVQALDVGASESPTGAWTPYIVLEWLHGTTLHRALREREDGSGKRGRPAAEAIALLEPAARALAVAHAQGVAHRDIKPANLFFADVGGRPTLKVLDFGIAKVLSESVVTTGGRSVATGHAMTAFTPRYAAPEQFSRAYGPTGPWTDVFAFALVLVEVIAGRAALDGDEAPQIYLQCCNLARRPTPRALGVADVPDELEAVLARALAVDPRRRYASLGELWDAVTQAVPECEAARPSERVRPVARLTTDLTIAVSPIDLQAQGPSTSAIASGSFDLAEMDRAARVGRAHVAASAVLAMAAGALGFAIYTSAADDQLVRAASAAAATMAASPSPTELPPPVVRPIAFRVPSAQPTVKIPACGAAATFVMDADDATPAAIDACVRSGACPAVPDGGALGSEHALAYCKHLGLRPLTRDEAAAALRALDASTFGLRCAR